MIPRPVLVFAAVIQNVVITQRHLWRADRLLNDARTRSGLLAKCSKVEPPRPGMLHAPDVWNRIIASAHAYAEPGVIFIDEVNRHNLLMASMGPKLATNPCATGDTLVYTEEGLLSARELYEAGMNPDVAIDALRLRADFRSGFPRLPHRAQTRLPSTDARGLLRARHG